MSADVAPVPAVWYRPMGAVRQVAELHGITTGLSDQLDELSMIGTSLDRAERNQ